MTATRKTRNAENRSFHAEQLSQIPPEVLKMMEGTQSDDIPVAERISELEETIRALESDNEILAAENRQFEEMKAQWLAGGFAAVVAGKDEEIRALLTRVASESREKATNFKRASFWKAEAIKLGYRPEKVK